MTCHDDYSDQAGEPAPPRYVVGLNGSPASATALRWAVAHAAGSSGTVQAVHVYAPATTPTSGHERAGAEDELRGFVVDAVHGPVPARLTMLALEGNPGRRLVELADGADLLVLGATHRRAVAAKVMGTTVARCSEHSTCPVVVVPETTRDRQPAARG